MNPEEAKITEIWVNKSKNEQTKCTKKNQKERKIEKTSKQEQQRAENSRTVQTNEPKRAKKNQQEHKWAEMIRFFGFYFFLISFLLYTSLGTNTHPQPPTTHHTHYSWWIKAKTKNACKNLPTSFGKGEKCLQELANQMVLIAFFSWTCNVVAYCCGWLPRSPLRGSCTQTRHESLTGKVMTDQENCGLL